jgi:thioredoxin reductase
VWSAEFRAAARSQIAFYNTTTFIGETVVSLSGTAPGVFTATIANGSSYSARTVILGSGLKDDLPPVPGLREAFGKGVYWCPWCDGFEHRDQTIGVLGNLLDAYDSLREMHPTLNKDIRIFANGTNSTAQLNRIAGKNPKWSAVFSTYNITVNNNAIMNITRVQSGEDVHDQAVRREFDKFRVYFTDGSSDEVGAFMCNYGTSQASSLPDQLDLRMIGGKIDTTAPGLRTTVKGVWGIGDANSDNSTNVPHAMGSGKKAAVCCHGELASLDKSPLHLLTFVVELASEELAQIGSNSTKRTALPDMDHVEREMGRAVEDIYHGLRIA